MAHPTFDSNQLFSEAEQEAIGSPRTRMYAETVPGADGEYVQPHGYGSRRIVVMGVLQGTTNATPGTASANFKTALRTRQGYADGSTVGTYVGTDSTNYSNCILESFDQIGPEALSPSSGKLVGQARCRAVLRQLTP